MYNNLKIHWLWYLWRNYYIIIKSFPLYLPLTLQTQHGGWLHPLYWGYIASGKEYNFTTGYYMDIMINVKLILCFHSKSFGIAKHFALNFSCAWTPAFFLNVFMPYILGMKRWIGPGQRLKIRWTKVLSTSSR